VRLNDDCAEFLKTLGLAAFAKDSPRDWPQNGAPANHSSELSVTGRIIPGKSRSRILEWKPQTEDFHVAATAGATDIAAQRFRCDRSPQKQSATPQATLEDRYQAM
jgi:hypothetical protein